MEGLRMLPSPEPSDATTAMLGIEVPVAGVEHALAQLWENDQASTKATLINLVIFSSAPGSLGENNRLVTGLTHDHACRVLLLESIPDATARAWITAHCHLSHGRKSVCSEQIAFLLDRNRPGLVRNTLLAHLLSDLPVIFWWQGMLDDAFEPGLFLHVDRLLVDSAEWPTDVLPGQLERILSAQSTMARPFSIHDLAWTRTYQFRIALAAMFDHPHAQLALSSISGGHLVVATGQRAAGALLVAWIAHALHWESTESTTAGWKFRTSSGREISFACEESPDCPPIAMVSLECPDGSVKVDRACGDPHLQARILDGSNLPPLVLPADPDAAGDLVAAMLSRGGKNSLYSSVLPHFLAMTRH